MAPDSYAFYNIVDALENNEIHFNNFLRQLFIEERTSSRPIVDNFVANICRVLDFLARNEQTETTVYDWVREISKAQLTSEIYLLSRPESSLHFVAKSATEEQIKACNIQVLSKQMRGKAPGVWDLLDGLLQVDQKLIAEREQKQEQQKGQRKAGTYKQRKQRSDLEDGEEELAELLNDDEDEPEDIEEQIVTKECTLVKIVSNEYNLLYIYSQQCRRKLCASVF